MTARLVSAPGTLVRPVTFFGSAAHAAFVRHPAETRFNPCA